MRIHLHDGSGHPFQVQLSRALAARGHEVLHTYATQWVSGHGRLERSEDDPDTFRILGITSPRVYDKYSPARRIAWEVSYARAWQRVLREHPCDVVVSCNTQLIAAGAMLPFLRRQQVPWVLWHQDIASLAIADEVGRKLPAVLARVAAAGAVATEKALVRRSSAVVAIGEPFLAQYRDWGLDTDHVRVIPNWAPLDEITPRDRDEAWTVTLGIPPSPFRLLYAGTLGRKHNPGLLADLVAECRRRGTDAQLVVASEGPGADDLAEVAARSEHVRVVGFQPAAQLPDMLADGDVLVALLEPEASRFSIPSKIFSYLAAGRPVLAFMPSTNPCADDVRRAGGLVTGPDASGVAEAAAWVSSVATDPDRLRTLGARARAHAEATFRIDDIASGFEEVLEGCIRPTARR